MLTLMRHVMAASSTKMESVMDILFHVGVRLMVNLYL